ncbi:RagB/SusD family nutrient uptake outer membrane protein [Flavobacterium sp.]|uniref:RagB/SusD family nutrient uptake outer membrane protein n=1 Tax=Flavobacterium sp. TaxID=239 RepID=UPI0037533F99
MKTLKNIIALGFLLVAGVSCDGFVEVSLPNSQLTSQSVFENYTTADAAMVSIYSKIRDAGLLTGTSFGLSNQLGCYADELQFYGTSGNSSNTFYNNVLLPTTNEMATYWNATYNQIYSANSVLAGVANSTGLTQVQKNQLKGEALFVRALLHFYLVNLYGAVPYITTTDYTQNSLVARMPIPFVYGSIKADLDAALLLLPASSLERVRPTQITAHALLASVYLYTQDWAASANEASAVLNTTGYAIETNLDNVFLKGSTSTLWQLKPTVDGKNTDDGQAFIFVTGPPPLVALSSGLIGAFSPLDQRKIHWTKAVTSGVNTWYHAYKYKKNANTATSLEYTILFRLEEQYLIRAEARAQQGDLIGASQDLNVVRTRAGLANTTAVNAPDIITAVIAERRLEFFTEIGHRFFDLKRTGTIDAALTPAKLGWNSTDVLFPLPQTELLANPNLTPQNPGY